MKVAEATDAQRNVWGIGRRKGMCVMICSCEKGNTRPTSSPENCPVHVVLSIRTLTVSEQINDIAVLKKDAERYRWLRKNNANPVDMKIPWCVHLVRENGIPTINSIEGAELDAAVDFLMKTYPQSTKEKP